jgi:hypothetical protein
MVIGNEQSIKRLDNFVHQAINGDPIRFPFLLLHGAAHIGKTTAVLDALGEYMKRFPQDVLYARDCWEFLEQGRHPLRAKLSSSDPLRTIRISKDEIYENKDTREIITRLSTSSVGPLKCVVIENAERMTLVAQNTLLKTLEEPLPGRLIIATCSQKNGLLDTLHSRAFHIGFELLSHQDLMTFLSELQLPAHLSQDTLVHFSLGRPGLIKRLLSEGDKFDELIAHYTDLTQLLSQEGSYQKKLKAFLKADELGYLSQTLVALEQFCIDKWLFVQCSKLLNLQRTLWLAIKPEQCIFDALL